MTKELYDIYHNIAYTQKILFAAKISHNSAAVVEAEAELAALKAKRDAIETAA